MELREAQKISKPECQFNLKEKDQIKSEPHFPLPKVSASMPTLSSCKA